MKLPIEKAKSIKKIKRDAFLYLDPIGDEKQFAQCSTCCMWTGDKGKTCTILGQDIEVTGEMSCGLYINGSNYIQGIGQEVARVTPEQAGLVTRQVRCENCRSFDAEKDECMLFKSLDGSFSDIFDLGNKVNKYGCCNAQMEK